VTPVREIDAGFDAGVMIGMHAMIDAEAGYMDHSFNSTYVVEMRVNDEPIGEIGIDALLCGYFGVPVVLVSGDRTACREARDFIGPIETVVTKGSFSRYATINRNPERVRAELRAKAEKALANREKIQPKRLSPPYTLQIRLSTPNMADFYEKRGAKRLDKRTILLESDDVVDLWAQRQGWAPGVHNPRFDIHPGKIHDVM
jgi:D-amino peptidase